MTFGAADPNQLMRAAERAFTEGRLEEARSIIVEIERVVGPHAAVLHLLALIEKKSGNPAAARVAFECALALKPNDPEINNNFGNLLKELEEYQTASNCYSIAIAAKPDFHTARYNRALVHQLVGNVDDALADLALVIAARPNDSKAHSARGSILREKHRPRDAAAAYDLALMIDPSRITALHGRALVATELGDSDAPQHFRRALNAAPNDREIRLGFAVALDEEDRGKGVEALQRFVAEEPLWWAGQEKLAHMRWENGEASQFARSIEDALKVHSKSLEGWLTYVGTLAAAGLHDAATEAAAAGQAEQGGLPVLALLEAIHASESQQESRADRLYREMPADYPGRHIHEMRHRIRTGDYEWASNLAERSRAEAPWDIGVWAMTGIIWRLTGDSRQVWLLEQPALVAMQQLDLDPVDIDLAANCLRSLHRSAAHPLGQSLRGGTQTRGRLFQRSEPEITGLRENIISAVSAYWKALPPADVTHPLLRHREAQPSLAGSWSVRLTAGGFHIAHMHPDGLVSSACYLVVPSQRTELEGVLEIGGGPDGLQLPLKPLHRIAPEPGRIALFPSYCYHGTRQFSEGERLSVAFDVVV